VYIRILANVFPGQISEKSKKKRTKKLAMQGEFLTAAF
jgi:hypothetical protein